MTRVLSTDRLLLAAAAALYVLPAVWFLATQSWTDESGSMAPIILCLGVWSLGMSLKDRPFEDEAKLSLLGWAALFLLITLAYIFFITIRMPSGAGFAAWLGVAVTFLAWIGYSAFRANIIPFCLTLLVLPLPYVLSARLNANLRHWVAETSAWIADKLGLDVALGNDGLIIGPYTVAVENACAGISTTLSLVAVGLLFAFWIGRADKRKAIFLVCLAIPIAMLVNLMRVVGLLALVQNFGVDVLETIFHPMMGIVSFVLAAAILGLATRLMPATAKGTIATQGAAP